MQSTQLNPPYLIFVDEAEDPMYAKTGFGMVQWRRDLCKGQLRMDEKSSVDLGLPEMSVQEAAEAGVGSLLIGTAAIGGGIPESWLDILETAVLLGLDVVAGVHTKLNDIPRLKAAADRSGSALVDLRVPPSDLPVGTGRRRSGRRLLTVGTDCAVGKKYTALALERDMRAAGLDADFRASGQTGIMIAGTGIPIDAVVSDFISGAAELLSPDNSPDHWDVIEGQGSIIHPGYGAVSHGLLIGSQPDAFVVCHEAGRARIGGWPDFELPSVEAVIERTVSIGSLTNPDIQCIGMSVNTSGLKSEDRAEYLSDLSKRLDLPCVDPLIDGTGPFVERLAV